MSGGEASLASNDTSSPSAGEPSSEQAGMMAQIAGAMAAEETSPVLDAGVATGGTPTSNADASIDAMVDLVPSSSIQ